jgi:hypothetical protein
MLRNKRLQMMAVLAVGALLGYLAAAGYLNPFQKARAAPPTGEAATAGSAATGNEACPLCCAPSENKGQLLTLANAKANGAAAANGKKPNILVIMGDDIG